jgi:hypothetical protein
MHYIVCNLKYSRDHSQDKKCYWRCSDHRVSLLSSKVDLRECSTLFKDSALCKTELKLRALIMRRQWCQSTVATFNSKWSSLPQYREARAFRPNSRLIAYDLLKPRLRIFVLIIVCIIIEAHLPGSRNQHLTPSCSQASNLPSPL